MQRTPRLREYNDDMHDVNTIFTTNEYLAFNKDGWDGPSFENRQNYTCYDTGCPILNNTLKYLRNGALNKKNVSNKSCMAWRGPSDGSNDLALESRLKVTWKSPSIS